MLDCQQNMNNYAFNIELINGAAMGQGPEGRPVGRPPTFDQMYSLPNGGRWAALKRDYRLARFLMMNLIFWATKGRRIRQAYRDSVAAGKPFLLDDNFKRML